MTTKRMIPIHPGEHLAEFLDELAITEYRLAKDTHVTPRRINEIVKGLRAVTPDTALRLGRYFGQSAEFWMNLQVHYDLDKARLEKGREIEKDIKPHGQAAA